MSRASDGSESGLRIAVIGAGWAGLAAALECVDAGASVTLFEMAPIAGGRARDTGIAGVDNGQHICIGAYAETLRLLVRVGIGAAEAFVRLPLRLVGPDGSGLRLPPGRPRPAFVRAVLNHRGWPWRDRFALLGAAAGWSRRGFACAAHLTVAELTAQLPERVRRELIEPLCVAALNTPFDEASGAVFLRVLRDSLAAGSGASDLLLPRIGLGTLLPLPALAHLRRAGATTHLARRVERIEAGDSVESPLSARVRFVSNDEGASRHVDGQHVDRDVIAAGRNADGQHVDRDVIAAGWNVDGEHFDRVVIAASANEAARLAAPHSPSWAARAQTLRHEPIATVYARSTGTRLPEPMLALRSSAGHPAQFVFDRGQLGGPVGLLAFVVSGAGAWLERGHAAIERAVLAQAQDTLGAHLRGGLEPMRTIVEKRATFACTPLLDRPPMAIAPGLVTAGDYVDGPYPATLEGAVRSGVAAARAVTARPQQTTMAFAA